MKTKLLRKVRKRYSITYYPHGFKDEHDNIYGECVVLYDQDYPFQLRRKILRIGSKLLETDKIWTKDLAFEYLRGIMLIWILNTYDSKGVRRNKLRKINEKLWYV